MTKAELVKAVATRLGIDRLVVQSVIDCTTEEIKRTLAGGDAVYLRGFGSFTRKHRASKTANDITRGTRVIVPAHDVPAFKPSPDFTSKLN